MKRSFVFYIHSIAGLVSGLFILLMSLSGAVLVYHEELDRAQLSLFDPGGNAAIPVDSAYHIVQHTYPQAQISSCELPCSKGAYSFFIYDPSYKNGEKAMEVFLHTQTGVVLKTRGGSNDVRNNFMSWLSKFHNSFHLGKTGEWLLGFFAIVFLLSLCTGLILFRKNIIAVLTFKRSAWKRNNLHQVIGVYALLFNLVIAVSGFWMQRYVFQKEFYQSYNFKMSVKPSPSLPYSFDSAYRQIQKLHPDFTAYVIYFAQGTKGKTAVYGSRSSNAYIHSRKFADVIFLDSTGAVAKTRFINEISSDDRYDIINSQLHMGKFGGWGIKTIYFLFGLSGSLLSITGFLLWLKRRKQNK